MSTVSISTGHHLNTVLLGCLLPVFESLPVLLLLAVLSPLTRTGEMPLKLLALVMAGRGASRLELSELSVLLQGRGSPCRGSASVSELLCRLAPDWPARNLKGKKAYIFKMLSSFISTSVIRTLVLKGLFFFHPYILEIAPKWFMSRQK